MAFPVPESDTRSGRKKVIFAARTESQKAVGMLGPIVMTTVSATHPVTPAGGVHPAFGVAAFLIKT